MTLHDSFDMLRALIGMLAFARGFFLAHKDGDYQRGTYWLVFAILMLIQLR